MADHINRSFHRCESIMHSNMACNSLSFHRNQQGIQKHMSLALTLGLKLLGRRSPVQSLCGGVKQQQEECVPRVPKAWRTRDDKLAYLVIWLTLPPSSSYEWKHVEQVLDAFVLHWYRKRQRHTIYATEQQRDDTRDEQVVVYYCHFGLWSRSDILVEEVAGGRQKHETVMMSNRNS